MKDELQLAPLTSRFGVAQARVAPDTGELFSGSIYSANAGWISYMLKGRQKSEFDSFLDCIIIESLHNPIVDA